MQTDSTELQRQLRALQERSRVLRESIEAYKKQIEQKQARIKILLDQAQFANQTELRQQERVLQLLVATKPAVDHRDDARRLATTHLRVLTETEISIYHRKKFSLLPGKAGTANSIKIGALRQTALREWEEACRDIKTEIYRLKQGPRESEEQRSLRNEVGILQRYLIAAEEKQPTLEIDIETAASRLAEAFTKAQQQQGSANLQQQIQMDRAAEAQAHRKTAEGVLNHQIQHQRDEQARRRKKQDDEDEQRRKQQVILDAQVQEALLRKQAAQLFYQAAQEVAARNSNTPARSSSPHIIEAPSIVLGAGLPTS